MRSEGWSPHKYPGVRQLVDGVIWDHEAVGSSPATWTNRVFLDTTPFFSFFLVEGGVINSPPLIK